jgi:DNA-binding GntR family transcriptional regulator
MARVYNAIKTRVMAAAFAPGERIDPARLSAELHASATPIRDALWRLAGERLVESWTQEGFRQPFVTEAGLRELFAWQEDLLLLILRALDRQSGQPEPPPAPDPNAPADAVFRWLAGVASNPEHRAALSSARERLHAAQLLAPGVIPNDPAPALLVDAIDAQDWREARRWVTRHHRLRMRAAGAIVAALHRPRTG